MATVCEVALHCSIVIKFCWIASRGRVCLCCHLLLSVLKFSLQNSIQVKSRRECARLHPRVIIDHRHPHHRLDICQTWQAERFQTFPNRLGWQEP